MGVPACSGETVPAEKQRQGDWQLEVHLNLRSLKLFHALEVRRFQCYLHSFDQESDNVSVLGARTRVS